MNEGFTTPTTTDKAYKYGRNSVNRREKRMSFKEFTEGSTHPFPMSLYRAYRKGIKDAQESMKASA